MLSAGGVGDRDGEERGHARAHNDHAGTGVFEALAGVALSSIAGPIQGQFKDLASEAMQDSSERTLQNRPQAEHGRWVSTPFKSTDRSPFINDPSAIAWITVAVCVGWADESGSL